MSREAELDGAVAQLLGVDSKLGILAGLTLVAKKHQELHSEDEDAATTAGGSPTDKQRDSNNRRTQRRNGSVHVGNGGGPGSNLSAAGGGGGSTGAGAGSSSASAAARKKQPVHDQRDVIRKLQEQNQILKQELSIESRDAKTMLSVGKRQQLGYLHKMAATFARKIDLVKKNAARIDELLAKKTQELEAVRQQSESSATGSSSASSALPVSEFAGSGSAPAVAAESAAASTRRLRALENRLELSLVKKNEMDSVNKHLRAQIEKVRKDRVIFDGIYKKLEKELSEYRQRHELSVEELKKAVDAKLQVNVEVAKIQARAEQEQRVYEQQFQALKASIEAAMREAARHGGGAAPGADIMSSPLAYVTGKGDAHRDGTDTSVLGATSAGTAAPKDSPLNRISALSSWKIGYDRALAVTTESETAKYEKAFAGIRTTTGMRDIAKIADEIVSRDETNFKRFKRVEELHQEEAALRGQIDELTLQIEDYKAQQGLAAGARQKQQLRAASDKLRQALDTSKAYDSEFEDTTTALTRIKSTVHSIHSMLAHANCARHVDTFSQGSAHLALGSHSARDITDANVLEYLQAIESFATGLMKETHESAAMAAGDALGSGSLTHQAARSDTVASASTFGLHAAASSAAEVVAPPSPIGHGPLTLPSDPSQKLRVHVPSVGGVNGVIVIPASSPFQSDNDAVDERKGQSSQSAKKSLHQHHAQQQQPPHHQLHVHQGLQRRKSGGRFELMARKSLSQVQFAAALAAAVESGGETPLTLLHHHPKLGHSPFGDGANAFNPSSTTSASGGSEGETQHELTRARLEEEEEERALTYDELRQFAAKNVVTKKSDDASLVGGLPASVASTPSGPATHGAGAGAARGRTPTE
ncbi:hypothetical protein PybrP1_010849 [[Pythium] brassicae (nom. inval.)]|nr:hypothetical protein PybrP1_010849 [[Pythium] brassicae (nom. inval.)]